ncbi:cysteine hydrolase family protein [Aquibaculum arenosum]|uniref:Cysteine hydrolase family protein n=1 Tax=Aquibaculum arenosum TaxID=3032591 RepID=A0ABT5YN10_9PROT|nr:cysteine hydrolase family protein [Fodinicurvata sp. CAU 1616]MDF2096222.1 cysteine hydrolase family protein [Fodinicurvata sp. CAU 1616]
MALPKTLMEMAGVPAQPHALASSALIIIDAQNQYLSGPLALSGIAAALEEGERLLQAARDAGTPIIHVKHRGAAGGAFDPDTPAFEIADPVAPRDGEAVVEKRLPNAFAGTDLDERLKAAGVKTLIVAGFMTHMCVSSTVRSALDHGYGTTVVANACATRDLPDGEGGVLSADGLHRAELAALSDRFAIIVPDTAALLG